VDELIPLPLLSAGQCAWVDRIIGRPDEVHRLEELGLRGGAAIEMLQGGSPCIIRLGGQKLCLRSDELASVLVRSGAPH
jgi:Fe2+ transport system protein FeoA